MTGRGDLLLAFAAATAVHAGAFAVGLPQAAGGGAGNGGANRISIEAASPSVAAMVRTWEQVPDVGEPAALKAISVESDMPLTVKPDAKPARMTSPDGLVEVAMPANPLVPASIAPLHPKAPQVPSAVPVVASLDTRPKQLTAPRMTAPEDASVAPDIQTAPPAANLAPRLTGRPQPRPAETGAPAVARQVASGVGDAGMRGSARSAAAPKPTGAERHSAASAWAADIQRRIARHHVYPRDSRDEGRVRVAMIILSSGKLSGVSVIQSSGSPSLDEAALAAVKRAAPFPPAPASLDDDFFNVGQWISFKHR